MTHQKNSPSESSRVTSEKQDAPSKVQLTSHGIQVVGRSGLEALGIDTSDELVISLGQTKRAGSSKKDLR